MQIDRLLEIVIILVNEKETTAKALAKRFSVSTRTIYRDVDTLTISGVPIEMRKGNKGGIKIADGYKLNRSFLSSEEKEELKNILNSVHKLDFLNSDKVISKMSALFNEDDVENWIEIDFYKWGNTNKKKFNDIKNAILNKSIIEITYYSIKGEKSKRLVEPMKILLKGYAWYLIAFCQKENDFRIFKMNRIQDINKTNKYFTTILSKEFSVEKTYSKVETIELILEFDKESSFRVYDEFDMDEISIKENDSLIVKTSKKNNEWLVNYMMSFGYHLKIIEPTFLADEVKNGFEKALKNYKVCAQ